MKLFYFFIFSILILTNPIKVISGTISSELKSYLQYAEDYEQIPVIMKIKDKNSPRLKIYGKEQRRTLLKSLKEKAEDKKIKFLPLLEIKKVKNIKHLWHIDSFSFSASPTVIKELSQLLDNVEFKFDKTILTPEPVKTSSTDNLVEWNIKTVKADELWSLGIKGQNVVIASLDTGVDITHPDLITKFRGGNNSWFDPYGRHLEPFDINGHGTQTLGVIVGGDSSGRHIGIAPDAKWIAAKIFDDNGLATYSAIHEAFGWLLDPDNDPNTDDVPDIVNNSWGFIEANNCNNEFEEDINILRSSGISVIFSAGNSGPSPASSVSPANNAGAISVGSVDMNKDIALSSARGPSACTGEIYPHVVAPGVSIKTTDLYLNGTNPEPYKIVNGTSFAAPHVSGALALLKSFFTDKPMDILENAIKTTSFDLGISGDDNVYGKGLIDVKRAYNILSNTPEIKVDKDSYNFLKVLVGHISVEAIFNIINLGGGNLSFQDIILSGESSNFYQVSYDGCSSKQLATNETCTVKIIYNPLEPGVHLAKLIINSNDPVTPGKIINLYGIGIMDKVTILTPNGGEIFHTGDVVNIRWGGNEKSVYFTLQYTKNNGFTWKTIVHKTTELTFNWQIPVDIYNRSKCKIRVIAYDIKNRIVGIDKSDSNFSIYVISINYPTGYEIILNGVPIDISWDTFQTVRQPYKTIIYFSRNAGLTWKKIALIDGNPGRYNWLVNEPLSNKCLLKIVLLDMNNKTVGMAKSSHFFHIN